MPNSMENPLVLKAAEFAAQKHKGQTRRGRDKSPYIKHPESVARIISEVGAIDNPEILAAAWLHDTLTHYNNAMEVLYGVEKSVAYGRKTSVYI